MHNFFSKLGWSCDHPRLYVEPSLKRRHTQLSQHMQVIHMHLNLQNQNFYFRFDITRLEMLVQLKIPRIVAQTSNGKLKYTIPYTSFRSL